MNWKRALHTVGLSFSFILLAGLSRADEPEAPAPSTDREMLPFEHFDLDGDARINESELTTAFERMQQRRAERRLARLNGNEPSEGQQALQRQDALFDDALMGTPEAAGAFMVDNFDEDGDWLLDREEFEKAFSAVRTWRRTERQERAMASLDR